MGLIPGTEIHELYAERDRNRCAGDDAITVRFRSWVHLTRPVYYGVFPLGDSEREFNVHGEVHP